MYTIPFNNITRQDIHLVGGKNAYLGDMTQRLATTNVKIPPGFAITTTAYQLFLQNNHLEADITALLAKLDPDNLDELSMTSKTLRDLILKSELPAEVASEVTQHFNELIKGGYQVAVRSSATAEDLPEASFAGQQETILNVSNQDDLLQAIKQVYSSLFTERAIAYRKHHNISNDGVAISIGIQRMIRSDLAASGVSFTIDTESGFDQVIFTTGSYGLGEGIVQGKVTTDEFYVHKPSLKNGHEAIVSRKLGNKNVKMVYGEGKENIKTIAVSEEEKNIFCISDQEILQIANYAMIIEECYQMPMDIEWAKDGMDGQIYIVQARPETVKSRTAKNIIEQYRLTEQGELISTGLSVGQGIAQGRAKVILDPQEKHLVQPGDILITDSTDPDWEPIMKLAAGIVTNHGGRTCHAAIIARELGIPAVVGCQNATQIIKPDEPVTLSCAAGETGYIYKGILKFEVTKTEVEQMPFIPIKILMNVAIPEQVFALQFIPNDGVGLARIEFIISNMIGIHPNAIINYASLDDVMRAEIDRRTAAYPSPRDFYIERLSEGIATIAAAFYPKPVIVRFSDFKSNEYAHLLGGELYEPTEENPMMGYRGAYRYTTEKFRESFAMECAAIKNVRERKGLTNVNVMVPFVRTVKEAENVVSLLEELGLKRGENGLAFYMMCEIPSNALLADEFLKLFDGFSIGSNDLTQLTLGVDRDSEQVADVFDERNEAVKKMLHEVISTCRALNKYVGICGQGPSDHPDFAAWLLAEGIETISLNPDTVIKTWLALAQANHTIQVA